MTARTKIAVSLPSELVGAAKQAVAKGLAPNVSAYVARAMEEQAKLDDLDASVVLCARSRHQRGVTSDPDDMHRLDPKIGLVIL
jgi:Arc/MetJ-type ribon-helix-helix transcriptional regulator